MPSAIASFFRADHELRSEAEPRLHQLLRIDQPKRTISALTASVA